jgi:predicted amidohydrolase YtcJ
MLAAATLLAACGGQVPGSTLSPATGPSATPTAVPQPSVPPPTPAEPSEPQIAFFDGVLLTLDDNLPAASAMLIQGDRIVAVGDNDAILAQAGPGAQRIDLAGHTMMPGFVDAHSHMFGSAGPGDPNRVVVQDTLLQYGVTTTAELYTTEALLGELRSMADRGALRVRLSAYLAYNDPCGSPLGDWALRYPPTRQPGEMLRIGGIKIFADGGSCNAPAVSFEYPGGYGQGDLYFSEPELEETIRRFDAAGYQIAIHALGDRALDVVLGAYQAVLQGENPHRDRIEHNSILRPDQYAGYSQAGVVATIFGPFQTCATLGDPTRFRYRVPEEHRTWEWPWRELIAANPRVHFAWHGDMPTVFSVNTFEHLYGFVTRNQIAEDGSVCQAPDWLAANAIDVDEALRLMTIDAAYALDRDLEVGSLTPGKFADVILLSDNPRTVDARSLADLQVWMTLVGGRVEYCRQGMEDFCPTAPAGDRVREGRDDFEGQELGGDWSWVRPDPARWSLEAEPGWLSLSTGDATLLGPGGDAPLLLQPAPAGDFELRTRLAFAPRENFQFAGLLVYRDDDHFVALGRGYCGFIPPCLGDGVYLDNDEAVVGGRAETIAGGGLPVGAIDLRLVRQGQAYIGYWSADGETWSEVGSTAATFDPRSVGLMAATSATGSEALEAEFDFFQATPR